MITRKKVWGEEKVICNNEKYCGKFLYLNRGAKSSLHYHKVKDETFYIAKGKVNFTLGKQELILEEGNSIRIYPKHEHSFEGLEDSIIIEFSTQHNESDVMRLTESYARQDSLDI